MKRLNNNQGFSMIELMIVVAIIGILAAIAVPQYDNFMVKARLSEGVLLLNELDKEILTFYAFHDRYPDSLDELGYDGVASLFPGLDNGVQVALQGGALPTPTPIPTPTSTPAPTPLPNGQNLLNNGCTHDDVNGIQGTPSFLINQENWVIVYNHGLNNNPSSTINGALSASKVINGTYLTAVTCLKNGISIGSFSQRS